MSADKYWEDMNYDYTGCLVPVIILLGIALTAIYFM